MHRAICAVYSVIQAQFSAQKSQVQCTACYQQTPNQYTATVRHYMHTSELVEYRNFGRRKISAENLVVGMRPKDEKVQIMTTKRGQGLPRVLHIAGVSSVLLPSFSTSSPCHTERQSPCVTKLNCPGGRSNNVPSPVIDGNVIQYRDNESV